MKYKIICLSLTTCFVLLDIGCDNGGKRQTVKGLFGRNFCLDVQKTNEFNHIQLGQGSLTLKEDMSFSIVNDTPRYSNLNGTWDVCCPGNDYGNYVFKTKGLSDVETDVPEFVILVQDRQLRFFFDDCSK